MGFSEEQLLWYLGGCLEAEKEMAQSVKWEHAEWWKEEYRDLTREQEWMFWRLWLSCYVSH